MVGSRTLRAHDRGTRPIVLYPSRESIFYKQLYMYPSLWEQRRSGKTSEWDVPRKLLRKGGGRLPTVHSSPSFIVRRGDTEAL